MKIIINIILNILFLVAYLPFQLVMVTIYLLSQWSILKSPKDNWGLLGKDLKSIAEKIE